MACITLLFLVLSASVLPTDFQEIDSDSMLVEEILGVESKANETFPSEGDNDTITADFELFVNQTEAVITEVENPITEYNNLPWVHEEINKRIDTVDLKDSTTSAEMDVCKLKADVGNCRAALPAFFWNGVRCDRFIYGGCGGNANNFLTIDSCLKRCGQPIVPMNGKKGDTESENGDVLAIEKLIGGFLAPPPTTGVNNSTSQPTENTTETNEEKEWWLPSEIEWPATDLFPTQAPPFPTVAPPPYTKPTAGGDQNVKIEIEQESTNELNSDDGGRQSEPNKALAVVNQYKVWGGGRVNKLLSRGPHIYMIMPSASQSDHMRMFLPSPMVQSPFENRHPLFGPYPPMPFGGTSSMQQLASLIGGPPPHAQFFHPRNPFSRFINRKQPSRHSIFSNIPPPFVRNGNQINPFIQLQQLRQKKLHINRMPNPFVTKKTTVVGGPKRMENLIKARDQMPQAPAGGALGMDISEWMDGVPQDDQHVVNRFKVENGGIVYQVVINRPTIMVMNTPKSKEQERVWSGSVPVPA